MKLAYWILAGLIVVSIAGGAIALYRSKPDNHSDKHMRSCLELEGKLDC